MTFIDTHCHLYLNEFRDDIKNVIQRAKSMGVEKFYLPSIDNKSIDQMLFLEKSFPSLCFSMIGLHPCSVKDDFKKQLKIVEQWLNARDFIAVGEIGLDFYWDKTFASEQYEALEIQIELALQRDMPIIIHTRNAMQETINTIKKFAQKSLKGIFHCFSGTEHEALEIIEMGFYLGIGGVLTYKNSDLSNSIQNISMDHIVLETDAPYLAPVPFRGKRNESSYIEHIAKKLAEVKKISLEEVAAITTANAEKIFNN